MAVTEQTVSLTPDTVARIQDELRAQGVDGWLIFNFQGTNAVANNLLGLPALTRRYFVWIPVQGTPVAVTHRIEQQPWTGWIGDNWPYSSWRELESRLSQLLPGNPRVAMEYAPGNAVPYVDRVPAGVIEMIRATGAEPVTSGDLVSAFYARWSEEGLAGHRRAARHVYEVAHEAFGRIAAAIREGRLLGEWDVRQWIAGEFARRGIRVGADAIVAVNENAANPHYAPSADQHSLIAEGDLVLIDLWGKEDEGAIYADQTWMGYVGEQVPQRLEEIFAAVRDARLAAIDLIRRRSAAGEEIAGWEADDASRAVIVERGWGEQFIHRTGHSIDRELHGSGPNIDNLESKDTRRLIPGVGFSIEPGIYLAGDVGFRSEVDVYMGPDGPEVTTPEPQTAVYALLSDPRFA
ncbi:MAG TPA: Xaa-Pro peptidase family protein [Longimicrobium sp.]|jgi:Xaa-Pro aminopeptidase|uniref:M24 family metallopeptidase n=1 Tax=Longimicrobium sp. TaxID=2029185 RepID=UPI002EDAB09C